MTTGIEKRAIVAWTPMPPFRAVLAVDARDFSALDGAAMGRVNSGIQELLSQAAAEVGLKTEWERRYFGQHTGDGYVAGFDPEVLPGLIGCFPAALRQGLLDWNSHHPQQPPLQLRVSVHHGPIPETGLAPAMVETHRLLDDQGQPGRHPCNNRLEPVRNRHSTTYRIARRSGGSCRQSCSHNLWGDQAA